MVSELANTPLRRLLIATVLGVALGLMSAVYAIENAITAGSVRNGPWHTNEKIGSPSAGMYLRAAIAVKGLLGLAREEVIYFSAQSDSAGKRLISGCDYQVFGMPPNARWWSITVYGKDNYLIDNARDIYSASASSLAFAQDGSFTLLLSTDEQSGNWIPTAAAGDPSSSSFDLTLRLYNPSERLYDNLATAPLPRITRLACDDE